MTEADLLSIIDVTGAALGSAYVNIEIRDNHIGDPSNTTFQVLISNPEYPPFAWQTVATLDEAVSWAQSQTGLNPLSLTWTSVPY